MKTSKIVAAIAAALVLTVSACAATHKPHSHKPTSAASSAQDVTVWVNLNTGIYHYPGERWYGKTKNGAYMKEKDAIAKGYRATENGQ